jgi:hypothetical protein
MRVRLRTTFIKLTQKNYDYPPLLKPCFSTDGNVEKTYERPTILASQYHLRGSGIRGDPNKDGKTCLKGLIN